MCKTTWPYGMASAKRPRDTAIAAGAVAVDWEYTTGQDVPLPSASQPAAASTSVASSHTGHRITLTPPPPAPAPAQHPPAAQSHPVAAAATPTPPAPQPPKFPYVVCIAEGIAHTTYLNPPIDGGNGNASTWMKAYRAYLQRYDYRGPIRCNRQPTRDAAQAFYDRMLAQERAQPGNGGVAPKIVVTEWK